MKKLLTAFVAFSLYITISAQPTSGTADHFVIKGNVKNNTDEFWEFGMTGFMGNKPVSIPIAENGFYSQTVAISHPQDIYLYLNNDAITLFAVPGDTLEVNWDAKDFNGTFQVISRQPWRQKELDLMMALYRKFRKTFLKLHKDMYETSIPDSIKFERVKKHFADELETVLTYPQTINSKKIFCDLYFDHIQMLYSRRLLSKFELSFPDVLPQRVVDSFQLKDIYFKRADEVYFYQSPAYRHFLFDYVRFYKPFNSSTWLDASGRREINITLNDCYSGVSSLMSTPAILDWFLAKAIMFGFEHYSFSGSDEAYRKFFPEIHIRMFRDTLARFYSYMQNLKPGNKAPDFSLKDEAGNNVSLSDFRGKVVYIDFWGVYCGPCRSDIEKYVPKLHEKYKDKDLVFINICVDVKEKIWKDNIKKLKLDGVNLLAEGWTSHPVCADYNVNGIPHYVLIDQNGNIVNNNANAPWALVDEKENEIDRLLK